MARLATPNLTEAREIDPTGNRLHIGDFNLKRGSGWDHSSYDANDRLTTDVYDANGNTTSSAGITNTSTRL